MEKAEKQVEETNKTSVVDTIVDVGFITTSLMILRELIVGVWWFVDPTKVLPVVTFPIALVVAVWLWISLYQVMWRLAESVNIEFEIWFDRRS